MFENCVIKYNKLEDIKVSIQIIYPPNSDGIVVHKSVPINEENTDYQEIMKWVEKGNTIEEAD